MVILTIAWITAYRLSMQAGCKYRQRRSVPRPMVPALRLFAVVLGTGITAVHADDNAINAYQQRLLFTPGQSQLKAESGGRVTIYDGLDDRQVDAAITQHFDRIENMMFVRTRRSLADGTVEYDDDCD